MTVAVSCGHSPKDRHPGGEDITTAEAVKNPTVSMLAKIATRRFAFCHIPLGNDLSSRVPTSPERSAIAAPRLPPMVATYGGSLLNPFSTAPTNKPITTVAIRYNNMLALKR